MGFTYFLKTKDEVRFKMDMLINQAKILGHEIRIVRCDNAGENVRHIQDIAKENNLKMEFTSPYTPQMNGVVERRIAVLKLRSQAMLNQADLTLDLRNKLWTEAVRCANVLENITSTAANPETPFELFVKRKSTLYDHLIEFGRIGYVTDKRNMKANWKNQAHRGIMVGYADSKPSDTYRMYMYETGQVVESRDIAWYDWEPRQAKDKMPGVFETNGRWTDEREVESGIDEDNYIEISWEEESPTSNGTQTQTQIICALPKSSIIPAANRPSMIPTPAKAVKFSVPIMTQSKVESPVQKPLRPNSKPTPTVMTRSMMQSMSPSIRTRSQSQGTKSTPTQQSHSLEMDTEYEQVYDTTIVSDPNEPKSIWKALKSSEKEQWKEAAISELKNFYSRDSWKIVPRSMAKDMEKTIIGSKWVFKKKSEADGSIRFKCRVVSKGYMQIPGIDYTERYSPVACDTTVRLVITYALYKHKENWDCELIDIEAAFLEGDIDKPTFMEWPPGMMLLGQADEETIQHKCIMLNKSIYGNVDAALRFYRAYSKHLMDQMGMERSKVNSCLFYLYDELGRIALVAVCHVDDTLLVGTPERIKSFKEQLKVRFNLKELG